MNSISAFGWCCI